MSIGKLSTAGSLRPKLILIVGLALAPLALASIWQGFMRVDAHRQEAVERLRNIAGYATWREQTVFPEARAFLNRLAARSELKSDAGQCARLLSNTTLGSPQYVNVSLIDATGRVVCAATAGTAGTSYAKAAWWQQMVADHAFTVGPQPDDPQSRRGIIAATVPLYGAGGTFTGALSVAIDSKRLDRSLASRKLPEDATIALLDRSGTILAANRLLDEDTSRTIANQARQKFGGTFTSKAGASHKWRWVIQPAADGGIVAAFGIQESWLMGITPLYIVVDIVLPLLMIAFAWAAIWMGTEWLVIRWTVYLQKLSIAYSRGVFDADTSELAFAPREFRNLGQATMKMAKSVQARDLRLNQALFQEKSLAREIHHRVKNNLQIVSSIIAIFGRQVMTPDAKRVLHQIVTRVDTLSLVHRLIEKSGPLPVVAMKPLLGELCEQFCVQAETYSEPCSVTLDIYECQLPIDVATPIALFTVEVMSLASAAEGGPLHLSLEPDGEDELLLICSWQKPATLTIGQNLHSPLRIMSALAGQIHGKTWMEDAGARQSARLRFPQARVWPQRRKSPVEDLGWGNAETSMTGRIYEHGEGERQSDARH